jgi:hypothetical protein
METYAIADLQGRYSLSSKQSVYDRIKAVSIEPVARGKVSYPQLDKLDKLDEHLKSGGILGNFESSHTEVMPAPVIFEDFAKELAIELAIELATPAKVSDNDSENFIELIERVAAALKPAADPLQHYAALERAIACAWILSSSEVRSLIGTRPKGDRFQRGSFVFIRTGKIGAQSAWRVVKVAIGGTPYKF